MTEASPRPALAPGRFRLLLLALLAYLVVTSAAPRLGPEVARFVEIALLAATLGIALFELHAPGQRLIVPITLAGSVIVVSVVDHNVSLPHVPAISRLLVAVFAGLVVWIAYGSVMRPHRTVSDRIVGAMCVYLLIGLGWASVFEALEGAVPGSFRFPADTDWALPSNHRYRYFSLVTLATLGYGDVTPVTALAGMLASLEAITGQFFIAITVARLVALSLVDQARAERPGSKS